jgi:hypothetical protein
LSIPGSSTTATKSSFFWNMLIGGKLPIAAVARDLDLAQAWRLVFLICNPL